MEFIKINDSSIKIMLTSNEVKEYELENDGELNENEVKKMFSRLLSQAKKELGFKYAKERLVAEIFSSKGGGCEIFISCLLGESKMYKDRGEEALLSKLKLQNQIFSFDDFQNLMIVLEQLCKMKCKKSTSVYYDAEKSRYCLILEDVSKKDLNFGFVSEFSKHLKSSSLQYITERYTPVFLGNAHVELIKYK